MVLLGALVNRFYLHFISTYLRIYAFKEVYLEILQISAQFKKFL